MGIFSGSNRREDRHAETEKTHGADWIKQKARMAQRLALEKAQKEQAEKLAAERKKREEEEKKRRQTGYAELARHTRVRNNRREY